MYAINPNRAGVGRYPTYRRLPDVPGPIDTVAICVNIPDTLAAVHEPPVSGSRALLVLGAGYAETGDAGAVPKPRSPYLPRRPASPGRAQLPRSLEPVWTGSATGWLLVRTSRLAVSGWWLRAERWRRPLMEPLARRGIALDTVATTGNEAGLDSAAFLSHLADDPRIRVIGVIAESIRRPDDLLAAARLAHQRGKQVVCLLIGSSLAGRSAARAHTAALVGDNAVARTFLSGSGILLVDDLTDLTEHLVSPSLSGGLRDGVAVTTVSGGGAG